MRAATSPCLAIPTMLWSRSWRRAASVAVTGRCSPPPRSYFGAAISRRKRADWMTRRAGFSARARTQLTIRRAFSEGGYYILGCDFETGNEIRLVADAGPVGYQTIAAHGHADALAFTLSVGGKEFLIDPGTYAFHTQGPWRRYFRGTAAHNTLRIDGMDQSQPGGTFMWLRKADARCTLWRSSDDRDVFEGRHDGYAHLPDPVEHRRRISLDKRARQVETDSSP